MADRHLIDDILIVASGFVVPVYTLVVLSIEQLHDQLLPLPFRPMAFLPPKHTFSQFRSRRKSRDPSAKEAHESD